MLPYQILAFTIYGKIQNYFKYMLEKHEEKINDNKNPSIEIYINKIKPYNSIMCGYFCIRFIDFMLKCQILLD